MTVAAYLGLLGVWVTAIASPGPDTVQLIRIGSRSRRAALWVALGISTGNILWPVVTMAGLSALIAAFPWILAVLYLGGGLFLLRMGVLSFRGGWKDYRSRAVVPAVPADQASSESASSASPSPMSDAKAWRLGLATNLSNPKALLFFGAVFAQFLPVDITLTERLLVLLLMTIVGVIWFCGFAWVVSLPLWAEKLRRANPVIEMAAGVIFVVLGAFLVWGGVEKILMNG